MRLPTNKWPQTKNGRALLFLAQLMREMLDQSSYESFRTPTLNTISRAVELLELCEGVQKGTVKAAAVTSALEEFQWSLSKDPIAKRVISKETEQFPVSSKNLTPGNPSDLQRLHRLTQVILDRLFPSYKSSLIQDMISSYDTNKKEYILRLLQSFFSLLVTEGWSSHHLKTRVEDRFFSKEIRRTDRAILNSFFQSFKHKKQQFRVWIPVNVATFNYIKKLEIGALEAKRLNELPKPARDHFSGEGHIQKDNRYVEADVERLDPQTAIDTSFEILEILTSVTSLQKAKIDFEWQQIAYVVQGRGKAGSVGLRRKILFQEERQVSSISSARNQKRHVQVVLSDMENHSSARTFQAIQNISIAQGTSNPNNQLVLIWSGIESLLSNPPENIPRITFFLDSLVPCLCLNYARRYSCAVFDELNASHSRVLHKAMAAVKLPPDVDVHTRFMNLMFSGELAFARMALLSSLNDNPLATHRLWRLFENFGTPASFMKSLEGHESRVRWQINRIYRARNSLVHGGDRPRYVEPLVLNAYEYFKSTFFQIVSRASKTNTKAETEFLIASIVFDYESFKADLSKLKKSKITPSDMEFLALFQKR